MQSDLINLLPLERVRAFRRSYFMRLAVVAALLLAGVLAMHAALLLPSYFFLHQQIEERTGELNALNATLAGSQEQTVSARIATLGSKAAYLDHLTKTPAASTAIAAVLALPRPGIRLTGFTYTAPTATQSASQMGIIGVASTREALRQYDLALSSLPYVASADLPIAAYAKETDIEFTITLTGSLMPPTP